MRHVILLAGLLTLGGCIGSNNDTPTDPGDFPDKGRTTIDPITPGVLCLTFDDGPSGTYSRSIIDILAKHQASAVFFMMGKNIPGNRDVLAHAQTQGQQVANHTYYHLAQPTLSEGVFKHRLRAVKANIGDHDNGRLFFRFPYGAAGDEQLQWIKDTTFDGKSYRVVGWNIDSQDWDFAVPYPARQCSTAALQDAAECGGQPNPFAGAVKDAAGAWSCTPDTARGDLVGWTQFIARKKTGGVMLFHDIQAITADHLDAILTGFQNPTAYWNGLDAATRTRYLSYYQCQNVDPNRVFKIQALSSGAWPSYRDL